MSKEYLEIAGYGSPIDFNDELVNASQEFLDFYKSQVNELGALDDMDSYIVYAFLAGASYGANNSNKLKVNEVN